MRVALGFVFLSGIALILPSAFSSLYAQDRCGTVEYTRMLYADPAEQKKQFEQWLSLRRTSRMAARQQSTEPYRIPVVVHIIHNGEPVGEGANIPEEQVLSQLRVLNEDFNRQNTDAAQTPAEFASVAGSLNIEFVLAKQDEHGMPSNGIVRVNGGRSGWTMADNYTLKALSYWPAEQYMNIWVCHLVDNYLGYAQHPVSNLPGLENSSTNRLTDGIVIWHRAFGSDQDGDFDLDPVFSKGRTATHEIAHFLGLNHIWGDDAGCTGTDYVDDTPNQAGPTRGCPSHPRIDNCDETVMFQNFLDYTDDACMNLFTQGQVDRMVVVLENSPRRNSLLSSPGLTDPDPLPDDLGIQAIVTPDANICSHEISPSITVRNYGENDVTQTRIRLTLNGAVVETLDFVVDLPPQATTNLTFSPMTLTAGSHTFGFEILLTNGNTDLGTYNNTRTSTVVVPAFGALPFALNLEEMPSDWVIYNPDGQKTWEIATAPRQSPTNKSLKLDFFGYEDKLGEIDVFLSPILDLSDAPAATLIFDVAHARYQGSNDRLRVVTLVDCQDLLDGEIVYDRAGATLATAPSQTSAFTPGGPAHWRREAIDLSPYLGQTRVQLAFVGINDWGNNLYLDNITLVTEITVDAAPVRLASPSPVTCRQNITPRLVIENRGTTPLNNITLLYQINDRAPQVFNQSVNIAIGRSAEVGLPPVNLDLGENTIRVSLTDVNGGIDENPGDNDIAFTIVVNDDRDQIPLRETFEGQSDPMWIAVNPTGGVVWETATHSGGTSMTYQTFSNMNLGDEAWLVSPVLDFSRAAEASLVYDLSQRMRNGRRDELRVGISSNCGATFEILDVSPPQPGVYENEWQPSGDQDWERKINVDLSALAYENDVRVAFIARNHNGNNLYIDNIEFFLSADPDLVEVENLFSVYGYDLGNPAGSDLKITFNLNRRQDVRFSLINSAGQMETDGILVGVLNQTYPLTVTRKLAPGLYYIRVQIDGKFHTRRVLVNGS